MKENEVSVLDQYDIDIKSTRRIRGAILCATNQGALCTQGAYDFRKENSNAAQIICAHDGKWM